MSKHYVHRDDFSRCDSGPADLSEMLCHEHGPVARVVSEQKWTSGPVGIEDYFSLPAQYPTDRRWNGWLLPSFDPFGISLLIEWERASAEAEGIPARGWEWLEDGALRVTENYDGRPEVEVVAPDADGLYSFGNFGWVWQEAVEGAPLLVDLLVALREEEV
jgi:hypothetical protein